MTATRQTGTSGRECVKDKHIYKEPSGININELKSNKNVYTNFVDAKLESAECLSSILNNNSDVDDMICIQEKVFMAILTLV